MITFVMKLCSLYKIYSIDFSQISLLAIRYSKMELNAFKQSEQKSFADEMPGVLFQWTFDLALGTAGEKEVCDIPGGAWGCANFHLLPFEFFVIAALALAWRIVLTS